MIKSTRTIIVSTIILSLNASLLSMEKAPQALMHIDWGLSVRRTSEFYPTHRGETPDMNDKHVVHPPFDNANNTHNLLAVFSDTDDNTGAVYAATQLPKLVQTRNDFIPAFEQISNEIKNNKFKKTAAIAALIDREKNSAHVAWSGNFRALLIRQDEDSVEGTHDTLVADTIENVRIQNAGCFTLNTNTEGITTISPDNWDTINKNFKEDESTLTPSFLWKKNQQTRISRLLGDTDFNGYVIPTPREQSFDISEDAILVLAGSGIWKTMDNKTAAKIVVDALKKQVEHPEYPTEAYSYYSPNNQEGNYFMLPVADALTKAAEEKGSKYNVTSLVVTFKDYTKK